MTEEKQLDYQLRQLALANANRPDASNEKVLKDAQAFYKFLKGEDDNGPRPE